MREHRQRSFDDLHAVAEDLLRTGVAARGHIGISGRSNGGVLVGAAANQRPDLYRAVISGSPLTDMRRYNHLLAGASWMAANGDPDKPRTRRSSTLPVDDAEVRHCMITARQD